MKKIIFLMIGCMLALTSCDEEKGNLEKEDEIIADIEKEEENTKEDINNQEVDYIEDEQTENYTEEIQAILDFYKEEVTEFPQLAEVTEEDLLVMIETNYGDITVKMLPEYAPKAVMNFITHGENGYYDGVVFHRVIDNFMIQGGDPTATGMGGESVWGTPFEDEFDKSIRHFNGALSMANSGPNTNGSQFFIVSSDEYTSDLTTSYIDQKDSVLFALPTGDEIYLSDLYPESVINKYDELGGTPHLDFNHTVFGQVVEGYDVVIEISNVETSSTSNPIEDVIINDVRVIQGTME